MAPGRHVSAGMALARDAHVRSDIDDAALAFDQVVVGVVHRA